MTHPSSPNNSWKDGRKAGNGCPQISDSEEQKEGGDGEAGLHPALTATRPRLRESESYLGICCVLATIPSATGTGGWHLTLCGLGERYSHYCMWRKQVTVSACGGVLACA